MAKKFWEISNNVALSANPQILLYGDISNDKYWGTEVTADDFFNDLQSLGSPSEIDVRINSGGGNYFAANAIGSLLKSHSAKINVFIDGLAASAASVIPPAGDKVIMAIGSMMMIHDPLLPLMGYYNVSDLEKKIGDLEKIKESIIDHYVMRTGKSREEVYDIMKNETWLSVEDALELGLADETDEDHPVNMFVDGTTLVSNNVNLNLSSYRNFPAARFTTKSSLNIENQFYKKTDDMNKEEEVVNIKDLQMKHPEIYNEVYNLGVNEERKRIGAINGLDDMGHPDIKNKAMFESGDSAGDVAMSINIANKKAQEKHKKDVEDDVKNSGMDDVNPEKPENKEDASKEKVNLVTNAAKSIRGIK